MNETPATCATPGCPYPAVTGGHCSLHAPAGEAVDTAAATPAVAEPAPGGPPRAEHRSGGGKVLIGALVAWGVIASILAVWAFIGYRDTKDRVEALEADVERLELAQAELQTQMAESGGELSLDSLEGLLDDLGVPLDDLGNLFEDGDFSLDGLRGFLEDNGVPLDDLGNLLDELGQLLGDLGDQDRGGG